MSEDKYERWFQTQDLQEQAVAFAKYHKELFAEWMYEQYLGGRESAADAQYDLMRDEQATKR